MLWVLWLRGAEMPEKIYDPPLDPNIAPVVELLAAAGVETFESCEGGEGHAYPEPTVRFHGDRSEGFRALAVVLRAGLPVSDLRRTWPIVEQEPTGPWWELTFRSGHGFRDLPPHAQK